MANSPFFNINDFKSIELKSSLLGHTLTTDSAIGPQANYDVFLSHSTKDKKLIKQIATYLESTHNISVYIDWDEDSGIARDEIADSVKNAMNISDSFLIVKTDNSDNSSWVAWETGYFDNKDRNRIGILLVEDNEKGHTHETFLHREYLKNYILIGPNDIVPFIKGGRTSVQEERAQNIDQNFRNNNITNTPSGKIQVISDNTGHSTKFFNDH